MFRSVDNHMFFSQRQDEFLPVTAALHNLVHRQGYQDIVLDFSAVTGLSPRFMVPLTTIARSYRREKVTFDIIVPRSSYFSRLLNNTNWLHLIAPETYPESAKASLNHLSAVQFLDSDQQNIAVTRSIDVLLSLVEGLRRSNLKALEWSLTEITDNVLNHSESHVGGVVQAVSSPNRQRIEFFVCDAGMGIARSLRQGRPELDDVSAVAAAIQEGVTKNKVTNQGNGLYGTFRCCEVSGGEFEIVTGNVSLTFRDGDLRVSRSPIPFIGTFVRACINYGYDKLLERALVFKGKQHDPAFDHVERLYVSDRDEIVIEVKREFEAFGSREAGKRARTKIENLMDGGRNPVTFDFSDMHLISSSFADEVFGQLFSRLGPLSFGQMCRFRNVDSTVKALIDRAISQRIRG